MTSFVIFFNQPSKILHFGSFFGRFYILTVYSIRFKVYLWSLGFFENVFLDVVDKEYMMIVIQNPAD